MRNGLVPPFFRHRRCAAGIAVALGLGLSPGCQKPIAPEGPTASVLAQGEDLDSLWDASLTVLNKFDFRPDRQDRALGVISTFPTTSAQWFEPWRQDVASAYDLMESSLATFQRKVTVRFVKDAEWSIEVQVDVYRLSRPETQITSASSVLHGFSGGLPNEDGYRADSPHTGKVNWVRVGRDGALEERLLTRILNAAGAAYVETSEISQVERS